MADWYVSATAGGGGAGTSGDPFTIVEAFAKNNYALKDFCWIKAGTYTITASLDASDGYMSFIGYNSTIGDLDDTWGETNKPLIQVQAASGVAKVIDFSSSSSYCQIANIVVDCTNASGYGIHGPVSGTCHNCVVKNGSSSGIYAASMAAYCIVQSCVIGIDSCAGVIGCISKSNSSHGFSNCTSSVNSVAYSNGGSGFFTGAGTISNCVSVGNTSYGFRCLSLVSNCIVEDNTGAAYYGGVELNAHLFVLNCNAWNSGASSANCYFINPSTSDPALVNPAGDDFSLGNSNLYGLGAYVGSLAGTGTLDLGAIQKSSGVGDTSTYPTASNVATDDASIAQNESATITCDTTNTPDNVVCVINDKAFDMDSGDGGATWSVVIYGYQIGVGGAYDIVCNPKKTGAPSNSSTASAAITVTSATAKTDLLLTEVAASLGAGYTVSLADEKVSGSNIISLVKILNSGYDVTEIDNIRTVVAASYSGWTNVTEAKEVNAPYGTDTVVYYKITHT